MSKVVLQVSDIIPANPLKAGDPPGRNATLSVQNIGPDPERALAILADLAQVPLRKVAQFEAARPGKTPVTMTLPSAYYDEENGDVVRLRKSGCEFVVTSYSWVCPKELADDHHWCTSTCSVVQIAEVLS